MAARRYSEVFKEYAEKASRSYKSFDEYQEVITSGVRPTMVKKELEGLDFSEKCAIIVLGFSGNGKTTFINNVVDKYPNFAVASMDTAVKTVVQKFGIKDDDMILDHFGRQMELASLSGKHVIVDGLFINLATRMVLCDYLKSLGYVVYIYDITPVVENRLLSRIDDVTVARYYIKMRSFTDAFKVYCVLYGDMSPEDIRSFLRSTENWAICSREIYGRYHVERDNNQFEEQVERNLFACGVDACLV